MNREKVIRENDGGLIRTGYLDDDGNFILHSFDDEPAHVWNDGTKLWYKDGLIHRDDNLPARIWSDGSYSFYKNGKNIGLSMMRNIIVMKKLKKNLKII